MQILHNCKHAKYCKHIISGLFVQNTPHLRIQKPCVACLWLLMWVDASESQVISGKKIRRGLQETKYFVLFRESQL